MDKNNNRLLIHKDMEHVTLENSVEIILTPQFYTFIREDLDLRFAYQAKQIAVSLFDDYIDTSFEYQYHVYKCDKEWCFFAYNIEEIEHFLESVGIEKHRVSKIYFAQQLNVELEHAIQLSEKNILQTIDNTVTIIPSKLMEADIEYKMLKLSNVKLSSGVSMGASLNSFISLKETIILGSLFFILGSVSIVEGLRLKSSIVEDKTKLDNLYIDYPKYSSNARRTSILNDYQPIDKKERLKRQSIKEISKFLSSNSQLLTMNIKKDTIKATIKASTSSIAKQVTTHTKAKNFKSSSAGLTVKIEKKL